MKVKIGNQSFDSKDIPIAIVFSEIDKAQIYNYVKHDIVKDKNKPFIFYKGPSDIPPETAMAWMKEAISEMKIDRIFH